MVTRRERWVTAQRRNLIIVIRLKSGLLKKLSLILIILTKALMKCANSTITIPPLATTSCLENTCHIFCSIGIPRFELVIKSVLNSHYRPAELECTVSGWSVDKVVCEYQGNHHNWAFIFIITTMMISATLFALYRCCCRLCQRQERNTRHQTYEMSQQELNEPGHLWKFTAFEFGVQIKAAARLLSF